MHYLADRQNQVIFKDEIFQVVWKDVNVTDDSLVQCISDIRKALGDKKHTILQTVHRRDYKLVPSIVLDADSQSEKVPATHLTDEPATLYKPSCDSFSDHHHCYWFNKFHHLTTT